MPEISDFAGILLRHHRRPVLAVVKHNVAKNSEIDTRLAQAQQEVDVLGIKKRLVEGADTIKHSLPVNAGAEVDVKKRFCS